MNRTVQVCLISLPLFVSFSFSQPLNPVGSLEVIDATGKRVGSVVSFGSGGHPIVAFQLNGNFLRLRLNATATRFIGFSSLVFETPDCSGQAYFHDTVEFLPVTSVQGPLQTLYVADLDAAPITDLSTKSRWESNIDSCTEDFDSNFSAIPGLPVINLTNKFTPPFKIVAETIISTASPGNAPSGSKVKLVGKGFLVGNAQVRFNGTAGLDVEVINDTVLLVTVPTLPLGAVDITVTTSGGTATLPGGPGGFTTSAFTAAIPVLLDWGAGLLMMGLLGAGLHHLRKGRIPPVTQSTTKDFEPPPT